MLSWRALAGSLMRLGWLSFRIAFHRKLLLLGLGVTLYYGALYLLAIIKPDEGFDVQRALYVLVEIPGAVLAVYLAMDLVAGERERDTLEMLFSTSMSQLGIWGVRLAVLYGLLGAVLLAMSAAAYLLFAEFPFLGGGLNALVPAFFMVNLTFCAAVLWRSGHTAGMIALAVLVGVLLTAEQLRPTPYFLFLPVYNLPGGVDAATWSQTMVINRLGVVGLGVVLLWVGFKRMANREGLLAQGKT
ncbi:MAG: hypothetical protein GKR89_33810 [Candidatus Latescibacteria bacterium]|nr:hypothetical protein [Candidatus Latescibacterota bacterium]